MPAEAAVTSFVFLRHAPVSRETDLGTVYPRSRCSLGYLQQRASVFAGREVPTVRKTRRSRTSVEIHESRETEGVTEE